MVVITGQVAHRLDRHRRLPGGRHRRHHPVGDQAQRAGDPGPGHPPHHPRGVPHRHHRPSRPGAGRHPQGHRRPDEPQLRHGVVLADRRRGHRRPARLPADHQGPPEEDQGSGRADLQGQPAGALRRRRHPQGPGGRGAARAGRADRHPGRHHADGPRRVPRRPRAVPGHAGHARQLHRGHRHAGVGPADRPGLALRRPGHRQARRVRPRRQDHPRRHRPGRAGQGPPARRADRGRLPPGHRASWSQAIARAGRRRGPGRPQRLAPDSCRAGRRSSR